MQRELVEALVGRAEELASDWHQELREHLQIRPESVFEGDELVDHMPEVIVWVVRSIEKIDEPDPTSLEAIRATARHWRKSGYSVEESLMHLRILSRLLHQEIRRLYGELSMAPGPSTVSLVGERLSHAIMLLEVGLVATYRDEAERRLDDLAGRLAHEIRNPIGAAMGAVEVLEMLREDEGGGEELEERRRRVFERMTHALEHASRMVDSVQHLARTATASLPEGEMEPLPELVRKVMEELGRDAGPVEIRRGEIPDILVPAEAVRLALHNLVRNGIRYADPEEDRPWVRVTCTHWDEAGEWHLSVEDNGRGIPEAERDRIFRRFRRGRDASGSGFGLGLSIVREATVRLGGEVRLESEEGEGSTFILTIPDERVSEREG